MYILNIYYSAHKTQRIGDEISGCDYIADNNTKSCLEGRKYFDSNLLYRQMNYVSDNSSNGQCSTRLGSSTAELDNELVTIRCDECGEYIPADNWDEHTDYHVAKRLQQSINQSSPVLSPQPVKHKTISKSLSKNKTVSKNTKSFTLDKYLTKK